jgi:O-antigen/teichoic acid export membrane protein
MPKTSLKRNTIYNLSGSLLSLAATLVIVPVFLHKIGAERFGVLAIIWLFIGYFGVFDLGLSRATANQIAKLHDSRQGAEIFWTAILLNAGIGICGGVVLYFAGGAIFQYAFAMPPSMRASVISMMPWLAASIPIATVTGVLTGVLEGCEKFLLVNTLQVIGSVLMQVVCLAVALVHGPELTWLIGAAILTRMLTTLPFLGGVLKTIPVGRPRAPRRDLAAILLGYGAWVTISNIINPIFDSVDKFLIGGISGLASVTYYAVPERLARRASLFPAALARTLFPRLSSGHDLDARETARRSLTSLIAVLTPITVVLILAMRPFLSHWIDPDFGRLAGPVGAVISISVLINGLAYVPYAFLDARGRPDLTAKFHLIEILPHVALLWFLLHRFGLIGGAWAVVLVSIFDAALLFWKSDLHIYSIWPFWQGVMWITVAGLLAPLYTTRQLLFYVLGLVVIFASIGWGLRVSPAVFAFARDIVRRLLRRPLRVKPNQTLYI